MEVVYLTSTSCVWDRLATWNTFECPLLLDVIFISFLFQILVLCGDCLAFLVSFLTPTEL